MTVIESTTYIERSPEDVFDYLVDLRSELEWNPGVESMELLTDGQVGVGSRYLAKWKQSKHIEVECVAFDRPHHWSYVNGGPVSVTFTGHLTPEGTGTRLAATFDAEPNGLLMRLIFPVFIRIMRRQERENMVNLKRTLEGKAKRIAT
ncbi:SRPBCC family protein [Catelliglobosispora koreensis]|uniref:SRPBCC family protein n=1 Tax=Catelliglobosispora koreensis TaxID=129052 RepID=UPI0003655AFE|nr:SRPBCC family protein [Catelliglobosispora koreensis]